MFAAKQSGTVQPKNIKRIPQPGPKPDRPEGKRDYPADRMRRGVEIQDPTALDVGWQHMRVVKQGMDGTGPPAKQVCVLLLHYYCSTDVVLMYH